MIHRKWTPSELTVLLACHYNAEDNNGLRDSPANDKAIGMWLRMGYIQPFNERGLYITTDRGALMVDALCSTPMLLIP